MADYLFTVFSLISALLCLPPMYFNFKIPSRPWATLILIGWIFILNLLVGIDSAIWANPDPSTWWDGKGYCDISARIKDMFRYGIAGAAIGVCRFLADATNPNPPMTDLKHTQRRRNLIDLFLGVIFPIILVGLKFIVESSRYHIIGVAGCSGVAYQSLPTVFIYTIWSPLLCTVAAFYACILHPFPY
jgi:pheromone a factor receptor